jgi:hypothetical protein
MRCHSRGKLRVSIGRTCLKAVSNIRGNGILCKTRWKKHKKSTSPGSAEYQVTSYSTCQELPPACGSKDAILHSDSDRRTEKVPGKPVFWHLAVFLLLLVSHCRNEGDRHFTLDSPPRYWFWERYLVHQRSRHVLACSWRRLSLLSPSQSKKPWIEIRYAWARGASSPAFCTLFFFITASTLGGIPGSKFRGPPRKPGRICGTCSGERRPGTALHRIRWRIEKKSWAIRSRQSLFVTGLQRRTIPSSGTTPGEDCRHAHAFQSHAMRKQ